MGRIPGGRVELPSLPRKVIGDSEQRWTASYLDLDPLLGIAPFNQPISRGSVVFEFEFQIPDSVRAIAEKNVLALNEDAVADRFDQLPILRHRQLEVLGQENCLTTALTSLWDQDPQHNNQDICSRSAHDACLSGEKTILPSPPIATLGPDTLLCGMDIEVGGPIGVADGICTACDSSLGLIQLPVDLLEAGAQVCKEVKVRRSVKPNSTEEIIKRKHKRAKQLVREFDGVESDVLWV